MQPQPSHQDPWEDKYKEKLLQYLAVNDPQYIFYQQNDQLAVTVQLKFREIQKNALLVNKQSGIFYEMDEQTDKKKKMGFLING